MADMLVPLYGLPDAKEAVEVCSSHGVVIRRATAPNKEQITNWVEKNCSIYAKSECEIAFSRNPIACFIATKEDEILGFACYDSTNLNFFGPTKVLESHQGQGIGKALLLRSLESMREQGYAYGIIGGVGPEAFYQKTVNAVLIEGSSPGLYVDFIKTLH